MRNNNRRTVPAIIENEIIARRMERALTTPDPKKKEQERWSRHAKAGTYTLAEKYELSLYGFKKR